MSMIDVIRKEMMTAMKNKDKERKESLSMLLSALKNAQIDKREDLTEAEENTIIAIMRAIAETKAEVHNFCRKGTFGSMELAQILKETYEDQEVEIELIGLCTDICVISNAMLIKAALPEVKVSVDSSCCAGVTPESHRNALEAMKMCQIEIV